MKKFNQLFNYFISMLILGILFKVMHWPGANPMMSVAFLGIGIVKTIKFVYSNPKQNIDYFEFILVVSWCLGGIFIINHWPYKSFFQTITSLSFIIWLILQLSSYYNGGKGISDNKSKRLLPSVSGKNVVWGICTVVIVLGAIFKIMHFSGSAFLLIFGMLLAAIIFLIDSIRKDRDE